MQFRTQQIFKADPKLSTKAAAIAQNTQLTELNGHAPKTYTGRILSGDQFIGQPEKVKNLFVRSATDLNRDRYFQGSGLVDLMRAIQSV